MDSETLWRIAYGLPIWATCLVLIARTVKDWPGIMERWNERRRDVATEKAGDWQRLREERDHYHELLKHCESERVDWMHRAIAAEAVHLGEGEARQKYQRIRSAERQAEAGKRDKKQ